MACARRALSAGGSAIGDGVTATVPLLWVVMICATFARPNGLFIAHFGWPRERVSRGMRYYLMSIKHCAADYGADDVR